MRLGSELSLRVLEDLSWCSTSIAYACMHMRDIGLYTNERTNERMRTENIKTKKTGSLREIKFKSHRYSTIVPLAVSHVRTSLSRS